MYRYSSANNTALIKAASSLLLANSNIQSRETAFDPLNYEFDAETIIEPFTYFCNGPTESRRKSSDFSLPSVPHLTWLTSHSNSILSSPDDSPQTYFLPMINEQLNGVKAPQNHPQQQKPSYPKTICRHCKSHNMPECLYTSHTMYDENGAIFCPVLKKCHCATCIRVTNPSTIRDDDSDDDNHIHLSSSSNDFSHFREIYPRQGPSRLNNNNNF